MKESLFVGAYWKARKETLSECADKIVNFLSQVSDYLNIQNWELKKRKKSVKNEPIKLDKEYIASKIKTNNRDDNNSPIQELGFNLALWTGDKSDPFTVSITCGAFSQFVKNSVILRFPPTDEHDILARLDFYQELLNIFIQIWNPDNLLLSSNEYLSRNKVDVYSEKGGWLSYSKSKKIKRI